MRNKFICYLLMLFVFMFGFISIVNAGESVLSNEERKFLSRNPVISLGLDSHWEPVVIDEDGKLSGYAVDLVHEVNKLTGANFEVVAGEWAKVLQQVRDGELDGMMCSVALQERSTDFVFSSPYLSIDRMAMILRGNSSKYKNIINLQGKRIAYQKGLLFDKKMAEKVQGAKLVEAESVDEMLRKLAYGQVDVVLGNAGYMIRAAGLGITTIKFAFNLPEKMVLVASFKKDKSIARDIFNKGLSALSAGKKAEIHNRWFGSSYIDTSSSEKMFRMYAVLLVFAIIFGGWITYLFRINKRLKLAQGKARRNELLWRESERQLKSFIANLPGAAFICQNDKDWTMDFISDRIENISGYKPEQIINNEQLSYNEIIFEGDRKRVREIVMHELAVGSAYELEYRIVSSDGSLRDVWESGCGVVEDGEVVRLEGLIIDISERKKIENALRESETRFSYAFGGTNDGLWDWNIESDKIYLNPRWYTMLGYDYLEFPGTFENWKALCHPDDKDRVAAAIKDHLREGTPFSVEFRMKTKNDKWLWILSRGRAVEFDAQGNPVRMTGTHVNISPRKELEEQLLMSRKLESIGQLAAGVAHEINTPIQYIKANLRFIYDVLAMTDDGGKEVCSEMKDAAKESISGIDKISRIVGTLKRISHLQPGSLVLVDVVSVINEAVLVSKNVWKYFAEVSLDLQDEMPMLYCDPVEIEQLVLNLIVNSAHALEDKYTGTGKVGNLNVKTTFDEQNIYLEVSDDGCGISEEHISKVYDPFFTTKEQGRGTGQGLSLVYSIVKKYDGYIDISSEYGDGTKVRIAFPYNNGIGL